jgi:uncharacterized protein YjbJ (UPF0337 family)
VINGRYEELVGNIQDRYGYRREEAANEVDTWLNQYDNRPM